MRLRPTEAALLVAVFLDMVGFTMLIPDIQLRADTLLGTFPYKGPVIGALLQATFVVQLLASPRWGRWADQSGRKSVFVMCQWLSALAMLMYGFAGSVAMLFVSRILAGFGGANVAIAQAMAASLAGEERKKIVLGRMSAALSAGMILGPAIGGFTSASFGSQIIGWIGAGISFLGGIIVLIAVPKDIPSTVPVTSKPKFGFDLTFFSRYPEVKPFFWIAVVASFALALLEGTFGRLIKAMFGYGGREFGLIFSYEAVLGILASTVLLTWIAKRLCDTSVLRLGYVMQGVGLALNPAAILLVTYAPGMVWLFIASTFFALGAGIVSPTLNTLASNSVGEEAQGELFGMLQSARNFGFIIGPLLGGALFDWHNAAPYLFAGAVCLFVAITLPAICACHPKRTASSS